MSSIENNASATMSSALSIRSVNTMSSVSSSEIADVMGDIHDTGKSLQSFAATLQRNFKAFRHQRRTMRLLHASKATRKPVVNQVDTDKEAEDYMSASQIQQLHDSLDSWKSQHTIWESNVKEFGQLSHQLLTDGHWLSDRERSISLSGESISATKLDSADIFTFEPEMRRIAQAMPTVDQIRHGNFGAALRHKADKAKVMTSKAYDFFQDVTACGKMASVSSVYCPHCY